jgi:uncharacterized protein YprB with RNaseH-like and TPR domain
LAESHAVSPDAEHDPKPAERAERLKSLRRKLSKLNRKPMAEAPSTRPEVRPQPPPERHPQTILYQRDLPREAPRRVPEGGGIAVPLEQCVEGLEARGPAGPPFYLIERSMTEAEEEPDGHTLGGRLAQALEALAQRAAAAGQPPPPTAPEHVCFLDLETTGLGCCPVFLVGTLVCRDGDLVCRQFLARDYAEEMAIVGAFAELAREKTLLVTFNGKTFDVPFLRTRAAATGVVLPLPPGHFDLLHEARRAFRHRLPDCKLKTLEHRVCGRHRGDDIPGSEIPAAYHDFVRSGDARQIALIVKHNQWDLVTMVHLMERVLLSQ